MNRDDPAYNRLYKQESNCVCCMIEIMPQKQTQSRSATNASIPAARPVRKTLLSFLLVAALCSGAFGVSYALFIWSKDPQTPSAGPPGMRWIPGGEFLMGTDDPDSTANERPAHRVRLDGFWMDEHDVTNAELKKQVPPGTPRPQDSKLVPGALVFTPPDREVPLNDLEGWWRWTAGADWRHPAGPGSNIDGKGDYPVVQVSWDDAVAYARWAGRRLPTEAEWEYAARGGLEGQRFVWGNEFRPGGRHMANTCQGKFPVKDTAEDGYAGTSPVTAFPPNGYGLYDMAGNVWQWCSDWYRADLHQRGARLDCCINPTGPSETFDPADPHAPRRVIKGGSFLCNVAYCESYRPSARRGTSPDTGSSHVGFRCALSADGWQAR